jgi:hypothetical protein
MTTAIADIATLTEYHAALEKLGLITVEDFVGAASAVPEQLSKYLGRTVSELRDIAASAPAQFNTPIDESLPSLYPLGARIEAVPLQLETARSLIVDAAPYPSRMHFINEMPTVKGQGRRDTCCAFASLAATDHWFAQQGRPLELSEQFLYWDCKQIDGHPTSHGTTLTVAFAALQRNGCCTMDTWQYTQQPIPGNEAEGPPPDGATEAALDNRLPSATQLPPRSVQDIRNFVYAHRCVAFTFPVYQSSYNNPQVILTGNFVTPLPGDAFVGGHAMSIVGFIDQPDRTDLGGGVFIVRNSWWPNWATQSPFPGYGTIPYLYVARFAAEAYSPG